MANQPMLSTQQSVMAAMRAVAMTATTNGTQNTVPATRGIIFSAAETAAVLYFTDAPTTAITMSLLAGLVYPFSVVAVKFAAGTCHALY
jgi:hypothetical protein